MDSAAPIPVPVAMRIPRLNMAEACPTPAVSGRVSAPRFLPNSGRMDDTRPEGIEPLGLERTELEFSGPQRLRRIGNQIPSEVALDAANHVVAAGFSALADDAKGVVLHNGRAADAAQQALLHPALKLDNGHLGRRLDRGRPPLSARNGERRMTNERVTHNLNFHRHFAKGKPWDQDAVTRIGWLEQPSTPFRTGT